MPVRVKANTHHAGPRLQRCGYILVFKRASELKVLIFRMLGTQRRGERKIPRHPPSEIRINTVELRSSRICGGEKGRTRRRRSCHLKVFVIIIVGRKCQGDGPIEEASLVS